MSEKDNKMIKLIDMLNIASGEIKLLEQVRLVNKVATDKKIVDQFINGKVIERLELMAKLESDLELIGNKKEE